LGDRDVSKQVTYIQLEADNLQRRCNIILDFIKAAEGVGCL
jgi:hypothetical protein